MRTTHNAWRTLGALLLAWSTIPFAPASHAQEQGSGVALRLVDPNAPSQPAQAPAAAATSGGEKSTPPSTTPPARTSTQPTRAVRSGAAGNAAPTRSANSEPASSAEVIIESGARNSGTSARIVTPVDSAPAKKSATAPAPAAKPRAAADDDKSLKPIAEQAAGPVEVEPASFNGVSPGTSTIADLKKAWGEPKQTQKEGSATHFLYSMAPFKHIEVTCAHDKVASLLIRFEQSFPAAAVAKQLELTRVRPVLVSNEVGEILGQVFPERGVLLLFDPATEAGKPSMKVNQIVLEPISAEPFVLRAETNIDIHVGLSLNDAQRALKIDPQNARACWLEARLLAATGDVKQAIAAAGKAVELEADNAQYRVTYAQSLGQAGRFADALKEADKALSLAGKRPHVKARAHCLLGDLQASSPTPDYKQAMTHHMEAIKLADTLADDPHPAIRRPAKEVLIDAHLGAAHDIAWGNWRDKAKAIARWLDRAAELTDDLVATEGANNTQRLHLCTRALAACVGARGATDPTPWVEQTVTVSDALLKNLDDPDRKAQFQWEVGLALYDALQVYQLRGDHDTAKRYGQQAIQFMEQGRQKDSPSSDYLLGRLYFRMGAVSALRDKDHAAAVAWFEKALPLLDRPLPPESAGDLGRHGETFVSMGVSFWETGRKDKGLQLSRRGVALMEQAAKQGLLDDSALAVAYNNLSHMHREMGQQENAEKFEALANRAKQTTTK